MAGIVALQWLLAPLTTPAAAPPVVDDAVPRPLPTPTSAWSTGCARSWARATARAPRWTGAASSSPVGSPSAWLPSPAAAAVAPATLRRGRGAPAWLFPAGIRGRAPPGADLSREIEGLTTLFTENREFYRVDTAISVPQIRPGDYRLSLTGMFDSPRSYTLPDLFGRDDLIERDVTLTCVSNEAGLAGTARGSAPSAPSCGRTASGRAATSSPAGTSTA